MERDRHEDERVPWATCRYRSGGSIFKKQEGDKAVRLLDEAGCRGITKGAAQVSEKHCNARLKLGGASSADIEALGEDVRERVKAKTGIMLEWEIQRIGVAPCGGPGISLS